MALSLSSSVVLQLHGRTSDVPLAFLQLTHPPHVLGCSKPTSVFQMWPHEHWAGSSLPMIHWLVLANTAQYYSNLLLQVYSTDSYLISALQALSSPFLQNYAWSQSKFLDFAFGFVELSALDSCYFHSPGLSRALWKASLLSSIPIPPVGLLMCKLAQSPAALSGFLKMLNSVSQMLCRFPFLHKLVLKKKFRVVEPHQLWSVSSHENIYVYVSVLSAWSK